eukprot:m.126216 g.126216  ORF g.126216 m.126216 type:complete len:273 (+) comp15635_c1_seq3:228-1046(+)
METDNTEVYIVHQGFLVKRGKNVKNWKRRWCVLKSNGEFMYYKLQFAPEEHAELPKPAGSFAIDSNCSVLPREDIKAVIDWAEAPVQTGFCVKTDGRDYYMSASSVSDRKIWLQRLRSVRDMTRRPIGAKKPSVRTVQHSQQQASATVAISERSPATASDTSNVPVTASGYVDAVILPKITKPKQEEESKGVNYVELDFSEKRASVFRPQQEESRTPYASVILETPAQRARHEYVNVQVKVDDMGVSHFALKDDLPESEEHALEDDMSRASL